MDGYLALAFDHRRYVQIVHVRIDDALHRRAAIVILDESYPLRSIEGYFPGESLQERQRCKYNVCVCVCVCVVILPVF